MRQLFLYGNVADNFQAVSAPFVAAAGGPQARIALLFPGVGDPNRFLPMYRDPWIALGASEVLLVVPTDGQLGPEALSALRTCTGIFMCGGPTPIYRQVYATGEAREIIRERHQAGVPYGGVSAGALLAAERCPVWGDRLTTASGNVITLRGAEDGCSTELLVDSGLGLVSDFYTEPHFAELGGFPRAVAALAQMGISRAAGIDNPICLEIRDEREALVHGRGRCYMLRRTDGARLTVDVHEPGTRFTL